MSLNKNTGNTDARSDFPPIGYYVDTGYGTVACSCCNRVIQNDVRYDFVNMCPYCMAILEKK